MSTSDNPNLQHSVRESMRVYFDDLGGSEPANLHDMLVKAVEKPLLEVVMDRAQHNQSRAAQWLGLNRNTLRKKLLEHGLAE
jgi:Fis family transcriptional regulator, factor for inversion stimulation protein